jgi:PAS domain S-box-containing protein
MSAKTQTPKTSAKILIAEDSPTQAQRLQYILQQQGYEVAMAGNGRLALELARQFEPTLVISDVVMPEMDGYELSRRIKADSDLRDIPVILVTTMSDPQDVIRGLECGADNFVLKPYDERYLLGRVRYVLANREFHQPQDAGMGVELYFHDKKHYITAGRLQILNLLLSTYDAAIERNKELTRTQEELQSLNTRLDAANTELHAANRFLDSVIENIPNMIFVKDAADLRFVRFNRAGEELLGYSRDDLLGKNDYDFFPKEEADFFTSRDREVLARGVVGDIPEESMHTRNKGERILHTRKVPVFDELDRPRYLLGISEDVTEQKEKEREILRLNAELEQRAVQLGVANQELESFSYSVSHDLRAPLRHIDGYVAMLLAETAKGLSSEAQRYLKVITDASRQMGQLIDDLLEFSRMGRAEMRKTRVDLNDLVRETMTHLETETRDRHIAWTIPPLPAVKGDPAMLKQVFGNLLGNAVKYTRPRDVAQIEIGQTGEEDGQLIFFVRDNGAGFDMKYADKLFGVFQRLHRAEEFEGTGVGLANVQRIIARHGGRIWAEAAPDKGATFYFTLKPSA